MKWFNWNHAVDDEKCNFHTNIKLELANFHKHFFCSLKLRPEKEAWHLVCHTPHTIGTPKTHLPLGNQSINSWEVFHAVENYVNVHSKLFFGNGDDSFKMWKKTLFAETQFRGKWTSFYAPLNNYLFFLFC